MQHFLDVTNSTLEQYLECFSGADGAGGFKLWGFKKYRKKKVHQKSLYATTMAILRIVATFPDERDDVVLYVNTASNSCFAVIPLRFVLYKKRNFAGLQYLILILKFICFRYAHKPELKQAALAEWRRISAQIAALQPHRVPGTNLEVKARGWPTNSDGMYIPHLIRDICFYCQIFEKSQSSFLPLQRNVYISDVAHTSINMNTFQVKLPLTGLRELACKIVMCVTPIQQIFSIVW